MAILNRSHFAAFNPVGFETETRRTAVLLSPIMGEWDEGHYYKSILPILIAGGYDVHVFDTLGLATAVDYDVASLANRWEIFLSTFKRIDLLGGAALGGSVVQALLAYPLFKSIPRVLLISSPTFVDSELAVSLGNLATVAARDGSIAAEARLTWLVKSRYNTEPEDRARDRGHQLGSRAEASRRERFIRGFSLLKVADFRSSVLGYEGRLLHIFGTDSRLVKPQNIARSLQFDHRLVGLDHCGMRPLATAPDECSAELEKLLEDTSDKSAADPGCGRNVHGCQFAEMKPKARSDVSARDSVRLASAKFIDIHYHANPDMYLRRRSAAEAGREYKRLNGWVVLKNHLGCTAGQAFEAREMGYPVSSSLVLNEIAGGLDWRSVERSLSQIQASDGRLIVHLPTVVPSAHRSVLVRTLASSILSDKPVKALSICDDMGRLKNQVLDILRIAKDYPVVISSGHAIRDDLYRLIDETIRLGSIRLLLNQPANPITGLSAKDLREITTSGDIFAEQCALTSVLGYQTEEDFVEVLSSVSNLIYSSDFGQISQPDISDWRTMTNEWFQRFELSEDRIDEITRRNPLLMLS